MEKSAVIKHKVVYAGRWLSIIIKIKGRRRVQVDAIALFQDHFAHQAVVLIFDEVEV